MRFSVLAALFLGTAAMAAAQTTANWSYEGKNGQLAWSKLDPSWGACAKGHEQSPIDIRGAKLDKTLKPIEFHYMSGPVTLENTGLTIVAHVDRGSYIMVDGVRYDLVSFDFRHPAEEPVKGRYSDMSIHLLHKSADGKMVIVAVRVVEDRSLGNAILAMLWDHLPKVAHKTETITDLVNPGGLLPADRSYWTYTGSLTTPPCTEGVQWFVFEQELGISRTQLRTFSSMFKMDTREPQDPHGRKILAHE
jgi:carbonic anhydrase